MFTYMSLLVMLQTMTVVTDCPSLATARTGIGGPVVNSSDGDLVVLALGTDAAAFRGLYSLLLLLLAA